MKGNEAPPRKHRRAALPRFFVPLSLISGENFSLPDPVVRHIHVLRLAQGDTITLFNGTGGEFNATLTAIDRKHAVVTVGQHDAREAELPYQITLAQGMMGNLKMDWLIEKTCELGIHTFLPLITSRSVVQHLTNERAQRRCAHWNALVCAACEQCGRNRLPKIKAPTPFDSWLATLPDLSPNPSHAFTRLMLSPCATQSFSALPITAPSTAPATTPDAPIILLIGPEGGLTEAEERAATAHGFTALHLGPRILRAETAGIAMLAGLTMRWGG